MNLTPTAQKFVLHWGEMGQAWGINRTMAQVHALLFVSPSPLDAEEISTLLDVSRSNVSTSLRELITWGVVRRVHIIGDRRDRFEALKDVMETFRVIMAERKRREMDPTIALLENCVREAKAGDDSEQYTREQLDKMLEFTRMVTTWYGHIDNLSTPALLRLFRGGDAGQAVHPWEAAHSRGGERDRRGGCRHELTASDRPAIGPPARRGRPQNGGELGVGWADGAWGRALGPAGWAVSPGDLDCAGAGAAAAGNWRFELPLVVAAPTRSDRFRSSASV
ncbi:MAG: MarR family transcriptional regulator [Isosphaeraceae bacterium]